MNFKSYFSSYSCAFNIWFGVTVQDIQAKPHVRNLTKVEYCTLKAKAKGKSIDEVYKEVYVREASLQSTMQKNVFTENFTSSNYNWDGVVTAKDPFVAVTGSGTFNWIPSYMEAHVINAGEVEFNASALITIKNNKSSLNNKHTT